jgi:hypothetical protein
MFFSWSLDFEESCANLDFRSVLDQTLGEYGSFVRPMTPLGLYFL